MKKLLTVSLLGLTVAAASSAQARDYDHVRIGVDVPYEPMEYRTPEGELTGFDIDLGNALCERIGVTYPSSGSPAARVTIFGADGTLSSDVYANIRTFSKKL